MQANQIPDEAPHRALRADARRSRERIIQSAWHMLARSGAQRFEMDELARDAEVSKGTLYRHFPNREAVLDAVVEEGALRIVAAMHQRIEPEDDEIGRASGRG